MTVPYTFATAVGLVPASELDANFAYVSNNVSTANTVVANAQPNITSVGTLTSLSTSGNIRGGNLLTAGTISATGTITTAGNLSLTGNIVDLGELWINTLSNGNINLNVNGTGNVNIPTGLLSVTGNIQGGNLRTAGLISATANITGGNLLTAGLISATANITGGNVLTGGLISATANITGGNLLTAGLISATANIITAGYFVGNFVGNITGNLTVPGANTQVLFNSNGNAGATAGLTFDTAGPNLLTVNGNVQSGNLLTTGIVSATGNVTGGNLSGTSVEGTLTTASQTNITSVGTLDSLSATGNIRTGSFISATGNVTAGNVRTVGSISATGNVIAGNLSGTNIVGTLTTAAQTNITSVGTLGSLSVTGNINAGNVIATNLSGPVFMANVSTGQGLPTSPSGISQLPLMYDNISANIGGGYIVGNSVIGSTFTAPVSGFYQVSAAIGVTPSNWANVSSYSSAGAIGVYKNNNPVTAGPAIDFIGLTISNVVLEITTLSTISTLVELDVGDTIVCKLAYVTTAPTNFWNTSTAAVEGYFQACWIRNN